MDEIKRDITEIQISQVKMAKDVETHIMRTNKLQEMTEPMYKAYIGVKWSIGAIICLGFIIGAIAKIQGLF